MRYAAILALLLCAASAFAQERDDYDRHADNAAHAGHDDSDHATRAAAGAEDPAAEPRPEGWIVRLDRPDRGSVDDVFFVDMEPGWHVTTGPAALLYHPESTVSGAYAIVAETFLFDPGERREGYGVFFGGRNLDSADQQYIYFLLRRDGKFLIKTRNGEETAVVRDWTTHPAIVGWENRPADEGTAANTLTVMVGDGVVAFRVNDVQVARLQASELPPTDGLFGLRVNHSLNLHVTQVAAVR